MQENVWHQVQDRLNSEIEGLNEQLSQARENKSMVDRDLSKVRKELANAMDMLTAETQLVESLQTHVATLTASEDRQGQALVEFKEKSASLQKEYNQLKRRAEEERKAEENELIKVQEKLADAKKVLKKTERKQKKLEDTVNEKDTLKSLPTRIATCDSRHQSPPHRRWDRPIEVRQQRARSPRLPVVLSPPRLQLGHPGPPKMLKESGR